MFKKNSYTSYIISIVLKLKKILIISILTGAIAGLLSAQVIISIRNSIHHHDPVSALLYFIAIIFGFWILSNLSAIYTVKCSESILTNLRDDISKNILQQPFNQLEQLGFAKYITAFNNDICRVESLISSIPNLILNLCITISVSAYLVYLSLSIVYVGSIFLIVVYYLHHYGPRKKAQEYVSKARKQYEVLIGNFSNLISGIKELILDSEKSNQYYNKKITTQTSLVKDISIKANSNYTFVMRTIDCFFLLVLGTTIIFLPTVESITPDDLVTLVIVVLYLIQPVSSLVNMPQKIYQAKDALNNLHNLNLLSVNNSINNSNTINLIKQDLYTLDLHNIKYKHLDDQFSLGPINLKLHNGEINFIVGENGAGKTTLVKVLSGLYQPTSGYIQYNDTKIDESNIQSYRNLFSTVFYDYFTFHELEPLDPERIPLLEQLINDFQLSRHVFIKDNKLITNNLSTGQQKRLALLFAIYENKDIYIFDEWAAEQDPVFKNIFYTKILAMLKEKNKLVIALTHDDRYFHCADKVIKLEYGQVLEIQEQDVQADISKNTS